jgi:hypothetical protein
VISAAKEIMLSLLRRRHQAYARVFDTDDDPRGDRQFVLDDLARFAHFGETVFHPDQRMTDVLIGRQEMLHRVMDYAKLDAAKLYEKYNADKFNPKKPQE